MQVLNAQIRDRGKVNRIEVSKNLPLSPAEQIRLGAIRLGADKAIEKVIESISSRGIAFVNGVESRTDFVNFARALGRIVQHPDSERAGVTLITNNHEVSNRDGHQGFSTQELFPHTDRSTTAKPPLLLLMTCSKAAPIGGVSTFVDSAALLAHIKAGDPELAELLFAPNTAIFHDRLSTYEGAIFEESAEGSVNIRFRNDRRGYFCAPLAAKFSTLTRAIQQCAFGYKLRSGEMVVLNNHRWLHGRTAFGGERMIWRLLVEPSRIHHRR